MKKSLSKGRDASLRLLGRPVQLVLINEERQPQRPDARMRLYPR